MAHQIVVDQEKGMIRLKHSNCVKCESLWEARQCLAETLKKVGADRILLDMREADLDMASWEKSEFSDGHKRVFGTAYKIAVLIKNEPKQYKDYQDFETLYQSRGIDLRVFDNEFMAEEWLLK